MESFREKLDDAKGYSEFVIALNLDIRDFSDWSLQVDSAQTALYVKRVYSKLIDRFFASAAFVKPTGDGLLVIIDFDEDNLPEVVCRTVSDAMTIVSEFATLCEDDSILNFDVPEDVGIGISRGAASRLASDELTIDYSGRVLNLASRLMDIARPKGIVFDKRLGVELLAEDIRSEFEEHSVYLKGVSPKNPIEVMCWPDVINIASVNRFPIGPPHWEQIEDTVTVQSMSRLDGDYLFYRLTEHPPDPTQLRCNIIHDSVTPSGRRSKEFTSHFDFPVEYADAAGEPQAILDQKALVKRLREDGIGPTWPITIEISYRVV